ncbi:MAG: pyridoxal phosphate-dependent aminotransferase [Ignavibacteriaceae bacterium]|jgi:aspartate/methionine/tyrosine aminotransferase|nr:MAG: pyridoxal phosphate-dependent aminotransferase [Chlorobiota bacterium]KXK02437.1 MAG: aspartate aminotransferase [Chlorobi bacterium OLB4]MBV6398033.1 Aspartate aminotransferase [Ignavibacteria bacterium]MCC6886481.1 pyridoxal phosphate-dependent aminotransferase [Ignavibacteriales bacterium]MCE7952443.1 pyridoxal phosphate-dependent aminotransferase [Chlorobi bacterium CHB7]MDL1886560.1 pyridoxal phosphate-dependent aminotransferase [Ignavibacteria bacterium CHB1]MEB2329722.1 pyridox
MDFKFADSMSRLGTETAFEVLAKAKALEAQGKHIIHLELGEPDFDTPQNIIAAAIKSLQSGDTHYTPSNGILPLRESIAKYMSKTRGVDFSADEVVVTPGAKPIMFFAIMALVNPGDEVIYPNPGFPIYESMINFVGGKPVPVALKEERGFAFDPEELRSLISPKTKMLIINTPQNPTGGILTEEDIRKITEIIKNTDLIILSDEIYSRLIFEGKHFSITQIPGFKERTIILDGFSKYYAMTGWRAGYGVMHPEIASKISRLITNSNSCTNSFVQKACIEALDGPQDSVDKFREEFLARREIIVEGLNSINGFSCIVPAGAFYAFPNISKTGYSSRELTDHLLNNAGVAALSGTAFGEFGEGYLRFSYANSRENIKEAIKRIKEVL